jgi:hypothetical protein
MFLDSFMLHASAKRAAGATRPGYKL